MGKSLSQLSSTLPQDSAHHHAANITHRSTVDQFTNEIQKLLRFFFCNILPHPYTYTDCTYFECWGGPDECIGPNYEILIYLHSEKNGTEL